MNKMNVCNIVSLALFLLFLILFVYRGQCATHDQFLVQLPSMGVR